MCFSVYNTFIHICMYVPIYDAGAPSADVRAHSVLHLTRAKAFWCGAPRRRRRCTCAVQVKCSSRRRSRAPILTLRTYLTIAALYRIVQCNSNIILFRIYEIRSCLMVHKTDMRSFIEWLLCGITFSIYIHRKMYIYRHTAKVFVTLSRVAPAMHKQN